MSGAKWLCAADAYMPCDAESGTANDPVHVEAGCGPVADKWTDGDLVYNTGGVVTGVVWKESEGSHCHGLIPSKAGSNRLRVAAEAILAAHPEIVLQSKVDALEEIVAGFEGKVAVPEAQWRLLLTAIGNGSNAAIANAAIDLAVAERAARVRFSGPVCGDHPDRAAVVEIEGRVLVCSECAADPAVLAHAAEDWR